MVLSLESIDRFRTDGHIRINGMLDTNNTATLRRSVLQAVHDARAANHRDYEASPMVEATLNVWTKSSVALLQDNFSKFATVAAQLLGVESIRLYHDASLFKLPGATATGWHQDNRYMVFDRTVTMWLALSDIPEQVGSLSFISGSHDAGDLKAHHTRLLVEANRRGYSSIVNYGGMNAGDATFHYGWTVHSANANNTQLAREVLVVIFYPDGEPMLDVETYETRLDNMKRWFPNGDADAYGPLHPIMYNADKNAKKEELGK